MLWLDGNSIEAAFEIESTTSIYSGILRMSDLLAQQPNISVPLFLVAPDERSDEVVRQVNRPTFERMNHAPSKTCKHTGPQAGSARVGIPDWLGSHRAQCRWAFTPYRFMLMLPSRPAHGRCSRR